MVAASRLESAVVDRRVVDVAEAGTAASEAAHGYAGHDAFTGVAAGRPYRQARGWMHYALTTFDDTEVTVALTFVAIDRLPRAYDVVVEDSLIATRTFAPASSAPVVVEFTAPFAITRGRTNIAVVIRARDGLTPALHEVRTIQDHNEVNAVDHAGAGGTTSVPSPSPRSPHPSGAAR